MITYHRRTTNHIHCAGPPTFGPTPEGCFAERIDGQRNGQAWKLVPNGLGGQQLAFVSQRADIAARTSGACKHWNDGISPFTRRASA
jgi:hypothetical protein